MNGPWNKRSWEKNAMTQEKNNHKKKTQATSSTTKATIITTSNCDSGNCCGCEGEKCIRYVCTLALCCCHRCALRCTLHLTVIWLQWLINTDSIPTDFPFFGFSFSRCCFFSLAVVRRHKRKAPQWKHTLNEPKINDSYRFHCCVFVAFVLAVAIDRRWSKWKSSSRILISLGWSKRCLWWHSAVRLSVSYRLSLSRYAFPHTPSMAQCV